MTNSPIEKNYCLESSFVIDLLNGKPGAIGTYKSIKGCPISISAIALFEILRGDEKNQEKIDKFTELSKRLDVLPFGELEAKEASSIDRSFKGSKPKSFTSDLFIGITAKTNNTVLITNDGDYKIIMKDLDILSY